MSVNSYDDYDDYDGRPVVRIALGVGAAIALAALLMFVVRPAFGGGTTSAGAFDAAAGAPGSQPATATPGAPTTTTLVPVDSSAPPTTDGTVTTDAAADVSTDAATDDNAATTTSTATTLPTPAADTPATDTPAADTPAADTPATDTPAADTPAADTPAADTPVAPTEQQPAAAVSTASYPTLPDGSPVPVLAIFDVDTITLSGTVPSQAAADRLATLALANSKTPASLVKFLAINPDVPGNVGVRVIEMTSSRFPAGSAEILPAHGAEIDRIATVMNALPNTTVLVIGHADQRGSDTANFEISEKRAQAVVSHLVRAGIDASRLSSRAVGEADLLTLADDETALELNRRTEFVIYGTLIGA